VNAQQKQPVMSAPMRMDNAVVDGPLNKDRFKTAGKKTRGGSTFLSYVDYVAAQKVFRLQHLMLMAF